MSPDVQPRYLMLIAQLLLALLAIPLLYAAPPAQGRILLIPVTGAAGQTLLPAAIANGARLVAAGPWKGSMLVEGQGRALVLPMLAMGVLPLAARVGGCGEAN
jgi:hypothetical protein